MALHGTARCAHCGGRFPGRDRPQPTGGAPDVRPPLPPEDRPPSDDPYRVAAGRPDPSGGSGPSGTWTAQGAAGPAPQRESTTGDLARVLAVAAGVVVVLGAVVYGGLRLVGGLGSTFSGEDEALAGEGVWTRFEDPGGRFVVDLPCDPEALDSGDPDDDGVRVQGWGCAYPSATIGVTHADFSAQFSVGLGAQSLLYGAPERHAEAWGMTLRSSTTTSVDGHEAVEYVMEADDGSYRAIVAVIEENRLYFLEVESDERGPEALDRLVDGFDLTAN